MWKYLAFALLIVFCVPAVFADGNEPNSTTLASKDISSTTTSTESTVSSEESPVVTNLSLSTDSEAETDETTTTKVPLSPTTVTDVVTDSSTKSTVTAVVTDSSNESTVMTTVAPATTTALPPPEVGKYDIKENVNKTCIKLEMALRLNINGTSSNFLTNASTDGSECNTTANTQIVVLTHHETGYGLTLIFAEDDKQYYVQNISLTYPPSETVNTSGRFFAASKGKSYLCNSDTQIKAESVTLIFSSVHLAFDAEGFGTAEECDADDKVGDIVPIAVGCALGALVIIVLIAYLVGRRRSRQRGYQSV